MVDPRRPLSEPTDADKAEQLAKYSPFLPLLHRGVVSYNHTLARITVLEASPTHLESASVVTAAGTSAFGQDTRERALACVLVSVWFWIELFVCLFACLLRATAIIRYTHRHTNTHRRTHLCFITR